MSSIKVTPDTLEEQGRSIVTMAENISEMMNTLNTTIETVSSEWDGLSQDAFYTSYQSLQEALKSFPTTVDGIGNQIISAAKAFAETDSQLANAYK